MDRTYHAWQTLRELEPTPHAKRSRRRSVALAILSALTLGYLLAVAPWGALVFLVVLGVLGVALSR